MPDSDRLLRKIETICTLTAKEKAAVRDIPLTLREFDRGEVIIRQGDIARNCFLVVTGVTCMFKITGDGYRQISIFHFSGDMPDLHSLHLDTADVTISALRPSVLGFVTHAHLRSLSDRFPNIRSAFWRATLVDASVFREWLLNLGQRPATMRVAHLLCETVVRMKLAGLGSSVASVVPLTQQEIGDCVGLSSIHVNRCVQELRRRGLIVLRRTALEIPDWRALQKAGDFDTGYLHLTERQQRLLDN